MQKYSTIIALALLGLMFVLMFFFLVERHRNI